MGYSEEEKRELIKLFYSNDNNVARVRVEYHRIYPGRRITAPNIIKNIIKHFEQRNSVQRKPDILLHFQALPGIEFCHLSDPNFDECVGERIKQTLEIYKNGVPELGIPKTEPLEISKFEIVGQSTASGNLVQKYTNMLTYGIYTSKIYDERFRMSKDECYWDYMTLTPHIYIEASYEMKGQLLVFPINGHGKSNVTLNVRPPDVDSPPDEKYRLRNRRGSTHGENEPKKYSTHKINYIFIYYGRSALVENKMPLHFANLKDHHYGSCELYDKKGKTYARLTKYQMDIDAEEVYFDFENIIPGNEQLSKEVLKTINENSQEIFRELKHGFEKVWSDMLLQTTNNVMGKIPLDELFPK